MISIIIVNFNGRKLLEQCLKSLSKINYENYEIILVDNNSTDSSIEFVKKAYPSTIIIKLDKNYGFAEPNNIGAKNAKGNFLVFLNNDTVVCPNFIKEMLKVFFQDSKIAICQSLLLKPNGDIDSSGDFIDTIGRAYSSREKVNEVKKILSAKGACMMVRKESFWDLGGFDKKIVISFEDVDLGWRAWLWGYKVVLAPNSIVYHTGGQTVKNLSTEVKFHGAKNFIVLSLVNFEITFALNGIIKLFLDNILRKIFGISIVTKTESDIKSPSLRITFNSILWVFKNFKYVFSKRKQVNSRRVRSSKDLIKMKLITN